MKYSNRQIFYKGLAETAQRNLEKNPEQHTEKRREYIKIFGFLGELTENEFYGLFDSGVFNDIVKAYCEIAAQKTGLNYEQTAALLEELKILFDFKGAKDILKAAGYAVNE